MTSSSSSSGLSGWKSTFTNVPPLTKSISTGMTVMSSLGFALRFRDLTSESDAESSLTQLFAMVPVTYVRAFVCLCLRNVVYFCSFYDV